MDYELCAEKIWGDLQAHNQHYGFPVAEEWADLEPDIKYAFFVAINEEGEEPSESPAIFYSKHVAGILDNKWGQVPIVIRNYELLSEPEQRKVAIITNNVRTFKERFLGR